MNFTKAFAIATLALSSAGASAAGTGSLSAGLMPYTGVDIDGVPSAGGTGLSIKGSLDVTDLIFTYGEVTRRQYDSPLKGLNVDTLRLGIGVSLPYSPFYLGLNVEQLRVNTSFSAVVTGGGPRGGVRVAVGSNWYVIGELGASVFEDDVFAGDAMFGVGLHFSPRVSTFLNYQLTAIDQRGVQEDATLLDDVTLGLRFDFY